MQLFARSLTGAVCSTAIAGCASTSVTLTPSPQPPVCDRNAAALVLWMPQWRPDQKDVAEREASAAVGIRTFFETSGCFARAEVRRAANTGTGSIQIPVAAASRPADTKVFITVRELGPVVKLFSSAALVEGGTHVVLDVAEYLPPATSGPREFRVDWQHGGPGVIKGVSSLPHDMEAALAAALQPGRPAR